MVLPNDLFTGRLDLTTNNCHLFFFQNCVPFSCSAHHGSTRTTCSGHCEKKVLSSYVKGGDCQLLKQTGSPRESLQTAHKGSSLRGISLRGNKWLRSHFPGLFQELSLPSPPHVTLFSSYCMYWPYWAVVYMHKGRQRRSVNSLQQPLGTRQQSPPVLCNKCTYYRMQILYRRDLTVPYLSTYNMPGKHPGKNCTENTPHLLMNIPLKLLNSPTLLW